MTGGGRFDLIDLTGAHRGYEGVMIKSLSRRERGVGPSRGGTGRRQRVLGNSTSRRVLALGCVLAGALLTAGPASAASRGSSSKRQRSHPPRGKRESSPGEFCLVAPPPLGRSCTPGPPYRSILKASRDGQLFPPNFLPRLGAQIRLYHLVRGTVEVQILGTDGFVEYAILNWAFTGITESKCEVVPSSAGHCTAEGLKLTFQSPLLRLGGPGNDNIFGGPGNNRISGGRGDDRISGGRGNDTLSGALATTPSSAAGATTGSPAAGATTRFTAAGQRHDPCPQRPPRRDRLRTWPRRGIRRSG